MIARDREGGAWDERDAFLEGDVQESARADPGWEADPEIEPAIGVVPRHARALELARQRRATTLLLRAVHVAQLRHVRRYATAPLELEDDPLTQRPGRRVHRLLRRGHAADDLAVGDHPAHAQTGKERLGERADRDDLRRRLARGEGDDLAAAVAQESVRIVFDDDRAIARGEIEERV